MKHEHRQTHDHRSRSGRGGEQRTGSRRSLAPERRADGAAESAGSGSSRPRHHHTASSAGAPSGRSHALFCLLFAGLGFAAVFAGTLVSRASASPPLWGLTLFAGTCAAVSLAAGVRAQIAQLKHWSRRVKRRLLLGLPLACCTALAVIINARERMAPHALPRPDAPSQPTAREAKPVDDSLVKPGWYGEILANGVLLVVTSFEENAAESRLFNRGLFKPVTYATLSVINTGSTGPVTLGSAQVKLVLEDGQRLESLSVRDLLAHGVGKDEAARRLPAEQQTIPVGGMIPDIAVCMEAPFEWSRVQAVEVALGSSSVSVPGHLMTAAEKQAALFRSPAQRAGAKTNVTAEAWFKDL